MTDDPWRYSASVHQASGMVAVQAMCTIAEAVQLMAHRASDEGYTLDEIAAAVIDRSIRFDQ
jgi:AmiR/NasT family two-component response regulator